MKEMKEGQYYYRPHRRLWGVYRIGASDKNGYRIDSFVSDYPTREQAESFVYEMNGWRK